MNKYQEEMDKARQCLIEKQLKRLNRIKTCPHGYRLIDLEDGTCSCDKCQSPEIESV